MRSLALPDALALLAFALAELPRRGLRLAVVLVPELGMAHRSDSCPILGALHRSIDPPV